MNKIVKPLRSGQITIPAAFREKLGIDADTFLKISLTNGELKIKPVKVSERGPGSPWLKELYDYFAPVRKEAAKYTEEEINADIDRAVREVRQKHAKRSV